MCASASRSLGGSAVMSAVRSVTANRAVFCCSCDTSLSTAGAGVAGGGVDGACARHAASVATREEKPTSLAIDATRRMSDSRQACDPVKMRSQASSTSSALPSGRRLVNARGTLQHRGLGTEPANRRFPHPVDRRREDQVRFDRRQQPGRFGELDVELPGAPSRRSRPPSARPDPARTRASCGPGPATPTGRRRPSPRALRRRARAWRSGSTRGSARPARR